jgi:hypothetical protein
LRLQGRTGLTGKADVIRVYLPPDANTLLCVTDCCYRGIAMLNIKVVAWALGSFSAISFIVCVLYGLIAPESLHMAALLEQVLPAFKWLTWWGFALGLIESFLYGAYAGLVYVPLYNWFSRRLGPKSRGPRRRSAP